MSPKFPARTPPPKAGNTLLLRIFSQLERDCVVTHVDVVCHLQGVAESWVVVLAYDKTSYILVARTQISFDSSHVPQDLPDDLAATVKPLFHTAAELETFLVERGWRYCFIGGSALRRIGSKDRVWRSMPRSLRGTMSTVASAHGRSLWPAIAARARGFRRCA